MSDLVTFGESMLRFSPPGDERIECADEYEVHVAGAESNVAVAAQRLGLDAAWTSKLPDSPVARKITRTLRSDGVTVDVAWSDDGRVGTYYLEGGDPPRETDVIYDRAASAVTTARPEELAIGRIEDASAFHTTGITPALSDRLLSTTATLLERAREAGTTTSFDLNYRSKLWSPTEAKAALTDLLPLVDVLVVAQRDARSVLDRDGDAEAIARGLADEFGFEVTVITRGSEGALAVAGDTVYDQPTFAAANTHPVGTGDAFVGGFLSQYVDGESPGRALEYAAATAALKRSVPGDIAVVTPGEVEAVLAGGTDGISR
ncbi:MAG: bifunctional 2-dehydro-3-deoxygluconokinase/2-dehydro-3-deoxygalactonokinase [Haloarculaceae archaeon]